MFECRFILKINVQKGKALPGNIQLVHNPHNIFPVYVCTALRPPAVGQGTPVIVGVGRSCLGGG